MTKQPLSHWRVVAKYRSEACGIVDVTYEIEELFELHDLIERGPHWDALENIEITRLDAADPTMTIERAGRE